MAGCLAPRAGLEILGKKKSLAPAWNQTPDRLQYGEGFKWVKTQLILLDVVMTHLTIAKDSRGHIH